MYLPILAFSTILILMYWGSKEFHANGRLVSCVLAYFLVCLAYKLLGVSSVSLGSLVVQILFFTPILLKLLPENIIAEKVRKKLFWITIIIAVLNIADNIRLCILHPEVMYIVSRNKSDVITGLNLGGNQFYVAVMFFFAICFFGFLNCKVKKYKILLLVTVIFSAIFILGFCFKAGIVVYTLLSVFLLIFARRAMNTRTFLIRIGIPAVFAFTLLHAFSDFFVEQITRVVDSPRLARRLIVLVDEDNAEAATGTVDARGELWLLSIETWLKDPINFFVGIGDHRVDWDGGQTARQVGIGNHSDFFDTPARYGLIGLLLIPSLITTSFKVLIASFDRKYRIQVLSILLVYIVFGFTYSSFKPAIGFMLFIFLPAIKYIIGDKTQEETIKRHL